MNEYVLDTSALVAYIENEEGVGEIENLFSKALDDEIELFISVVSCIEIFYTSWREQGEKVARERLKLIEDLPLIQEPINEDLIHIIGEIKAERQRSFADCCIAGLAKFKRVTLVHKDPEYEQIENEIQQLKLPYKKTKKRKRAK